MGEIETVFGEVMREAKTMAAQDFDESFRCSGRF